MHFKYLKQMPGSYGDWRIDFPSAFSVSRITGGSISADLVGRGSVLSYFSRGDFILFPRRESEHVGCKSG